MSIKEYKELIERENSTTSLEVLKAQKELLIENKENSKILAMLNGKNVTESIMILNAYLENKEEGVSTSNEKTMTHTLSNPSIPKFMISNEDDGFSNIILLSLALIILGIIVLMIIFA